MTQITIIGLGPGDPELMTRKAWSTLNEIGELWLRTRYHPVVRDLPPTIKLHSFDDIYEQALTFDEVYNHIADKVLQMGQNAGGVFYAVPGHPLVGESTVSYILAKIKDTATSISIIDGISFIEPTLTALSCDALDGLQIVDAMEFLDLHHPPLNPDYPALIAQVYSRSIASTVKLVLMNQYPDEHSVTFVDGAGTDHAVVKHVALYDIDRIEYTPLSSLFVEPITKVSSFESFQQTIAKLRSPEGCPWDREQTHETLRMNVLEECYEVLTAIDSGDAEELMEELGDLLLQVVLQTQIAVDDGEFQMPDVIAAIDAKLKRRHPHVWKGLEVDSVQEVVSNWEDIKRQERQQNGKDRQSLLDGIPKTLPALTQAFAFADRGGRIGLHLDDTARLPEKLIEAVNSFRHIHSTKEQEQIIGQLLFTIVMWSQHLGVDPESTLRETNKRFADKLRILERQQNTKLLDEMSDDDICQLWD